MVEFTTYVVGRESLPGYLQGRSEVYADIYPNGDFPPNTLIVVAGLVNEDLPVEIKTVAVLPWSFSKLAGFENNQIRKPFRVPPAGRCRNSLIHAHLDLNPAQNEQFLQQILLTFGQNWQPWRHELADQERLIKNLAKNLATLVLLPWVGL